jgi:hypothetical protein
MVMILAIIVSPFCRITKLEPGSADEQQQHEDQDQRGQDDLACVTYSSSAAFSTCSILSRDAARAKGAEEGVTVQRGPFSAWPRGPLYDPAAVKIGERRV